MKEGRGEDDWLENDSDLNSVLELPGLASILASYPGPAGTFGRSVPSRDIFFCVRIRNPVPVTFTGSAFVPRLTKC